MSSACTFQKGNLISLKLRNFKGVRELSVEFSPTVNFLIAPNGHGKSSVLEAVALCLGSRMEDANDLVYEGEESAEAQLTVFDQPVTSIYVVIGRDGQRTYRHDRYVVQCSYIQKLARKYKIYIDNPFVSMMQHTAQKVMDVHPFDRLKYLLDVSPIGDNCTLNVDVKDITQRCEVCSELFLVFYRRRSNFQRYSSNFHIIEQTEQLRRLVAKMEVHLFFDKYLGSVIQLYQLRYSHAEGTLRLYQAENVFYTKIYEVNNINQDITVLEETKESQFSEFKYLYNKMSTVQINLRRHQQQLRQAMVQERTLQSLSQNNNAQKKKDLEDQITHLKNEIQQLQENCEQLRQEELHLQGEDPNEGISSLNTLHSYFYEVKQLRQYYYSDLQSAQNSITQFRNWFQYCYTVEEEQKGLSFLIFPAIGHIAVNRLSLIPENDAKLVLLYLFGNDIYTIYTQSFDVTALLSRHFRDFPQASSVQTLPRQFFGKSYEESYEIARLQLQQIQYPDLKLRKLKKSDVIPCANMLLGNPIVLYINMNRLQSVYYILHNTQYDDNFLSTEIDFIFQNNPKVTAIAARGRYYRALKYDGVYNGRQLTQLNSQKIYPLLQLIRTLSPNEFRHLPDVEKRYRQVEIAYNQYQSLLENAREASRLKYARISDLRAAVQRATTTIQEKNNHIYYIYYLISKCRVVTYAEFDACEVDLADARAGIATYLLQLADRGFKALRMQVGCAGVLKSFKALEIALENAKMAAEGAKVAAKAEKDILWRLEDQMNQAVASCAALEEQARRYGFESVDGNYNLVEELENRLKSTSEGIIQAFEEEPQRSKQETLEFYKKRLSLQIGRQNVDIEKEQREIVELYVKMAREYAFIRKQTLAVFERFEQVKSALDGFIKGLNYYFTQNMQKFGVSGQMRLKTWKNNETACQKDYHTVLEGLYQDLPLDGLPYTPQELSELFMRFYFDFGLLARVLRYFAPGVDLNTRFAAQEVLKAVSLSGGEKSVVSLCLACSLRAVPLRIIDEINQGMDEHFENCANDMIKQIQGQVVVSSPKLSAKIDFSGVPGLNVIMIMRREIE